VGKSFRGDMKEIGLLTTLKLWCIRCWPGACCCCAVNDAWRARCWLLAALPTGSLVFVLSSRYGVYTQRSTGVILASTLVSVATLSLIFKSARPALSPCAKAGDDLSGGTWLRSASGSISAEDKRFGPGKARLLELIRDTGSISAAARALGMSYRRAVAAGGRGSTAVRPAPGRGRSNGGVKGGGARSPKKVPRCWKAYRRIRAAAEKALEREMKNCSAAPAKAKGR